MRTLLHIPAMYRGRAKFERLEAVKERRSQCVQEELPKGGRVDFLCDRSDGSKMTHYEAPRSPNCVCEHSSQVQPEEVGREALCVSRTVAQQCTVIHNHT